MCRVVAGHRVGPGLLAHLVDGMGVKPGLRHPCHFQRGIHLFQGVLHHGGVAGAQPVSHGEGRAHVETVEPDLPRVAQLVPPHAGARPRVRFELPCQQPRRVEPARIARHLVEIQKRAPCHDVVDVVLALAVSGERRPRPDLRRDQPQQVVQPDAIARGPVQKLQPAIDAAVLVTPRAALVGAVVAGERVEILHQHGASSLSFMISGAPATSAKSDQRAALRSSGTCSAISGTSGAALVSKDTR